jgi:CheY-like chemotaxis protein
VGGTATLSPDGDCVSVCNILLVDDHADVREVTALLLRDCGHSVIETPSGSAALAVLDLDPTIELLMVDFAMPEMSGSEVLQRARTKRPGIRAVFITGYADYAELSEEFADEIVLKKPFTTDQLALAVRKAMGRSGR